MAIPCYFINLDRALRRREHMEAQARRTGLRLQRISGIDGSALSVEERQCWNPRTATGRQLTAGEIGCFLSHRKAWQAVAEGSATYAAVFEDDVFLSDDSSAVLQDWRWLPDGTELVKTETFMRKVFLRGPFHAGPAGRRLARLSYQHYGTGGYILSKRCAAKLLAATETFHVAVDIAMFSPKALVLPNMEVLQLLPAICIQQMQSPQHPHSNAIEPSALQDSRVHAKGDAAVGVRRGVKQAGQSIENAIRAVRQNVKAALTGNFWDVVEFR
jgi:glycosyl transferase family 25